MAEIKWIKITTDIFDDEKILMIESMPSADSMIVIWFKLLTFAGKQNNDGVFLMSNRIAYTDEMLASIFRRDIKIVRLALKTFESFGMIEIIENVITIPNWGKHQTLDSYEKKKQRDRLYQRERRNKQKQLAAASPKPSFDESSDKTSYQSSDKSLDNRFMTDDTSLSIAISEKEGEKEREKEREEDLDQKHIGVVFSGDSDGMGSVFQIFEHCGFQMTGYTRDTLQELTEVYSANWVTEAIRRAADRGKKSLGYVKGILERWQIAEAIDQGAPERTGAKKHHENSRTDNCTENRTTKPDGKSDAYEKFFK